jgi:signal transduction histidine kinase
MRHSIGFQLNALFVLLVTAVLSVSGALTYWSSSQQLNQQYAEARNALQERIQINLPLPIWNMDMTLLGHNLTAELKQPVSSIAVYDESGRILASKGQEPKADDPNLDRLTIPLNLVQFDKRYTLGRAEVVLSREQMVTQLHGQILSRVAEILLLDLVLVVALSLALRLLVLKPLAALKRALEQAAEHQGQETLTLPAERQDEFGDVVRSFNLIAHRLADDLKKGLQAEAEIRQAYEQLKQAQATLMQSEKLAALGGLVAGVAHEINTPVGITLTCASLLSDKTRQLNQQLDAGALKKSDVQSYVQMAAESVGLIQINAERAAHLVQSFKQVAVDQTSEGRREFDLAGYLNEVIESLRPKFKHTKVQVKNECEPGIKVDGYPGAFAQIVTNLLVNALTHAFNEGQEGTVTLSAERNNGQITLHVEDDGNGIAPEHLPRVFDPFFTTRRSGGGSGLGLHIVYNIVTQRMGGQVSVDSHPKQGTRFILSFPATAPRVSETSNDR